jgi:hypothetical protein
MAACALVVIVAFGSACATSAPQQITPESFRSLQKDVDPKPTHIIKANGSKAKITLYSVHKLSVLHNGAPLAVPLDFSMTDTELRFELRNKPKPGQVTDLLEDVRIPLNEVTAYYFKSAQAGGGGVVIALGLGILVLLGVGLLAGGVGWPED